MSYLVFRQPLPPDHVGATLNHDYLEKFEYLQEVTQCAELIKDEPDELTKDQSKKTFRSLNATSD